MRRQPKPLKLLETLTLDQKKHMVIKWIEREKQEGHIPNQKEIAKSCGVAYSTLCHAIWGRESIQAGVEKKCKLTAGEEEAILNRCSLLSSWLQPARHTIVQDIAVGLLRLREPEGSVGRQ